MTPGIYRHFKQGLYRVLHTARFNTTSVYTGPVECSGDIVNLDGMEVAVYVSLKDGSFHVRPVSEFSDYVLDPVEGNRSIPRFERVGE